MRPFESSEVTEIVGIKPIYLNKFVERRVYGIAPSARSGEGRGSRRWFTADDVFGIALVWWLFEAGLRTEVIKRILRELGKSTTANANHSAKALRATGAEYSVIRRGIRSGTSKEKRPPQLIRLADFRELNEWLAKSAEESFLVLPVRRLFGSLASQLNKYEKFEA